MGKTVQVVPAAQRLNERMLGNDRAALGAIASSQQKIAAMRANPDFQHAENTARLDALSEKLGTQKAALEEEIAAREELRDALVAKDKDAAAKARGKLKAIRAGHAKDYGKGESVVVCQECIDRKLHAIRKVRTPATPEAMTDLVTGVFEGSEPDYCKIKPADASCRPCDPNGPDEASFLQALNEERRSYVTSLGGDAADSTYREDFFADMLNAGNTDMQNDFVIRGIPVKGLPAPVPPVPSPP